LGGPWGQVVGPISSNGHADALARPDSPAVLEVRNLDVGYGKLQVTFGVTFDVRVGEVVAILGANGAGKSTLLRGVTGLLRPFNGSVWLHGEDISGLDTEARVRQGLVLAQGGNAVFPSLSVLENLRAAAFTLGRKPARLGPRIDGVLDLFPRLRERLTQRAGTLSGGERQMLALAKVLLLDAEILCIDELSLGLAPVVVQELVGVVDELKHRGTTMIIVEQSTNVALSVADRVIFLEKGRVQFEKPAAELQRGDALQTAFLGS
jgi:ABC-type branched-subunit amino acid transport system ATPase component